MPFAPATRLGPYEILAPIGAGGMGEVYRAVDTRLGRTVAIKTLNTAHMERFEREARAIAALNHPHICALYDIGPNYLVMEYVDGAPVKGPLPLAEALRYAAQIAQALEAAHAKGIAHRDLKPANIVLTAWLGIFAAIVATGRKQTGGPGWLFPTRPSRRPFGTGTAIFTCNWWGGLRRRSRSTGAP